MSRKVTLYGSIIITSILWLLPFILFFIATFDLADMTDTAFMLGFYSTSLALFSSLWTAYEIEQSREE